jgi:hypothetical protein
VHGDSPLLARHKRNAGPCCHPCQASSPVWCRQLVMERLVRFLCVLGAAAAHAARSTAAAHAAITCRCCVCAGWRRARQPARASVLLGARSMRAAGLGSHRLAALHLACAAVASCLLLASTAARCHACCSLLVAGLNRRIQWRQVVMHAIAPPAAAAAAAAARRVRRMRQQSEVIYALLQVAHGRLHEVTSVLVTLTHQVQVIQRPAWQACAAAGYVTTPWRCDARDTRT